MYRKLLSANLFTGHQLLKNNKQVLIAQENGTINALVPIEEAGDDIEQIDGLLCPGFVNAHCHLELSQMKGVIPEKTGMVGFIFDVMGKRKMIDDSMKITDNNSNPPTVIRQPSSFMSEADKNMWANGIQAVGDICNTVNSLSTKQNSHIYYHNFIEVSGFVPAGADGRFAQAKAVSEAFNHQFSRHQTSITPHSPYSVSKDLFAKIADEEPKIISVHNQESQAENDFIFNKTGDLLKLYAALGVDISFFNPAYKSSLQYMLPMLSQNAQKLFVHNCFTTQEDLNILSAIRQSSSTIIFCLCPNANLYIGNPLPNVEMLIQSGFQLCLGTDSLASNHQLSILEEIKTLQQFFPKVTTESLLQMATINGAKALQTEEKFGSFDKGKTPGILQINGFENGQFTKKAIVQRIA